MTMFAVRNMGQAEGLAYGEGDSRVAPTVWDRSAGRMAVAALKGGPLNEGGAVRLKPDPRRGG